MNKKKWDWKGCDRETKWFQCGCYNEDRDQRKVVWSLPTTSKDAGKHKGPGNGTYHEAKEPVTGQAEGTETPNTAEDSAKHATPSCTNHHKAKDLIQTHLKNEEEKI